MEQTVKTALLAELLGDVDKLLQRLEAVDQQLTGKIEDATSEAAGRAFVQLRLGLQRSVEEHRRTLMAAGNSAAAEIEQRLKDRSLHLLALADAMQRSARLWLLLCVAIGLACGLMGGGAAVWLLR